MNGQIKKDIRRIPGYPRYTIDTKGNVFGIKGQKLKLGKNRRGYYQVGLYNSNKHELKRVHRLVLETFIGKCPIGMHGCHNNGVKTDNRLENLRWDTPKNNVADKRVHGTLKFGENHYYSKLNRLKVRVAIHLRGMGWTCNRIAKLYKVTSGAIAVATRGDTWRENGKKRFYRKMNPLKVRVAIHLQSFGWSNSKIGKIFDVHKNTVQMATRGKSWKTHRLPSNNKIYG